MRIYRPPVSENDFLKVISKIRFGKAKEKIIALGGNLTIRAYTSGSVVFFYRSNRLKKLTRLGRYIDDLTFKEACNACEKIHRCNDDVSYYLCLPRQHTLLYEDQTNEPIFQDIAESWLNTKKELARFANYRKCIEYLSFLNPLKLSQIKNVYVKNKLIELNLRPYKLRETISVLCRVMDFAVQDEYLDHHNLHYLMNSECFPKPKIINDGYKYVEFENLEEFLPSLEQLSTQMQYYFLMLIFTCLRPGECRQLKFEYFDIKYKVINVPGSVMKVKTAKPFRIPLTDELAGLFCNARKYFKRKGSYIDASSYIFQAKTSTKPLCERDISTAIKMCSKGTVHPHGFRKTARSYFAEQGVNLEVAAMCLAHKLNTGADAVYQKSDLLNQRRDVMMNYHQAIFEILPDSLKKLFNLKE